MSTHHCICDIMGSSRVGADPIWFMRSTSIISEKHGEMSTKKCKLFKKEVNYLQRIVSANGYRVY